MIPNNRVYHRALKFNCPISRAVAHSTRILVRIIYDLVKNEIFLVRLLIKRLLHNRCVHGSRLFAFSEAEIVNKAIPWLHQDCVWPSSIFKHHWILQFVCTNWFVQHGLGEKLLLELMLLGVLRIFSRRIFVLRELALIAKVSTRRAQCLSL